MNKITFLLLSCSLFSVQAQNWWEQGLVAHYAFDSLSVIDSSASQAHLTGSPQIQATTNRRNQPEKAIDMPDATDFVMGSSAHLPTGIASRSFSVWIYVNQLPGPNLPFAFPFFYGARQENQGQGLGISDIGRLSYAGYKSTTNSTADLESIATIGENQWVHVGMSFDGDTAKLYINGQLDNSSIELWNTTANQSLHFGRMGATPGNMQTGASIILPYNGALDDFRAYDRELSPLEMEKLANDDFSSLSSIGLVETRRFAKPHLYPNPATSLLYVESTIPPAKVDIYTLSGQLVSTFDGEEPLDVAALPEGVYLVAMLVNQQLYHQRLVKH